MGRAGEEALEEASGGLGIAVWVDLQVGVAGARSMATRAWLWRRSKTGRLAIDVDEADARLREDADRAGRAWAAGWVVERQATMDGSGRAWR